MTLLDLQPDATDGIDSMLTSVAPDTNYATEDEPLIGTLVIGKNTFRYRFIVRFDLTAIPSGSVIDDSTLSLFKPAEGVLSGSWDFDLLRVTQLAWTEIGCTWNVYDVGLAWAAAGGDFTETGKDTVTLTSPDDLVFTGTGHAQDIVDNRSGIGDLLCKRENDGVGNGYIYVATSDHATPGLRPRWAINYTYTPTSTRGRMNVQPGHFGLTEVEPRYLGEGITQPTYKGNLIVTPTFVAKSELRQAYLAVVNVMISNLPVANSILVSVKSFRAAQTGTEITTDASMVFNIYDSAGTLVEGPISMTHDANGDYYGTVNPSPALTENALYRVVITSTTNPSEWVRWFKAEKRTFQE